MGLPRLELVRRRQGDHVRLDPPATARSTGRATGTTLLNVSSDRPHYWKAETLDALRRPALGARADQRQRPSPPSCPTRSRPRAALGPFEYNPRWDEEIRGDRALAASDLLVGAGTTYRVDGAARTSSSGDGTIRVAGDPLEEGDSYTVAPTRPTRRARADARARPASAIRGDYAQYTRIQLPSRATTPPRAAAAGDAARESAIALRQTCSPAPGRAGRRRRRGRAGAARLALRATCTGSRSTGPRARATDLRRGQGASSATSRRNYTYSERPPTRPLPLDGFLFRDEVGYCQQFSGAMALMLRMAGHPGARGGRLLARLLQPRHRRVPRARPRRPLLGRGLLHRHRLGAVRPHARRPRRPSRSRPACWRTARRQRRGRGDHPARRARRPSAAGRRGATLGDEGGTPDWLLPFGVLVAAGPARRRRRWYAGAPGARARATSAPSELAEAQLAELRRALDRLDWDVPAATTLLGARAPAAARRRARRRPRYARRPARAPLRPAARRPRRACASAARCAAS